MHIAYELCQFTVVSFRGRQSPLVLQGEVRRSVKKRIHLWHTVQAGQGLENGRKRNSVDREMVGKRCNNNFYHTSMECAMLRHCSMPGMSSWSTRRSLHLMVIVPEDPDILHTDTQLTMNGLWKRDWQQEGETNPGRARACRAFCYRRYQAASTGLKLSRSCEKAVTTRACVWGDGTHCCNPVAKFPFAAAADNTNV